MAAGATPNLSQLNPRQQSAGIVLARQAALREVRRMRKQGLRQPLAFSTLARLANEFLERHPEMVAEAALDPIVQNL